MSEKTDEEIAFLVQKGDIEAFGMLVTRYENKMLRYARRFLFASDDARDVVQDVFIKAFTNINSFDTKRHFSPWIYRIAHNQFINQIKKKGKEPVSRIDTDTFFPHLRSKHNPAQEVDQKELQKLMDASLDKLKPKYREVLVLHYYEDLKYAEIAEVLRIPTSTVGVRISRAKAQLGKIVKKQEE